MPPQPVWILSEALVYKKLIREHEWTFLPLYDMVRNSAVGDVTSQLQFALWVILGKLDSFYSGVDWFLEMSYLHRGFGLPKWSMLPFISSHLFDFFCWTYHWFLHHVFLFAAGGFSFCHYATPLSHWESFQGAKPQIGHWRTGSFYKGIPPDFCVGTGSPVVSFHADLCHKPWNFSACETLSGTNVSCC